MSFRRLNCISKFVLFSSDNTLINLSVFKNSSNFICVKFFHLTPKNHGILELIELFSGDNVIVLKALFILSDSLTTTEFIDFLKLGNADPKIIQEFSELPKFTSNEQLFETAAVMCDKYENLFDEFNIRFKIPSSFNFKDKFELIRSFVSEIDPVLDSDTKKDLKNGLENFQEVITDCENETSSRHSSSSDVSLSSFFNPSKIVKR